MKNVRFILLALSVFILMTVTVNAQKGYEINIKIKELKNQPLILGHYFASGKNTLVDDTVMINSSGEATFKSDKKLTGGMYFLYYPGHLHDVLVTGDQHFSIETDTMDFVGNAVIKNSLDNQLLYDYQKFRAKKFQQQKDIQEQMKTAGNDQKKKLQKELEKINEEMKAEMDKIIKNHPESFFSKFLIAAQDVEVPDEFKDEDGKLIESKYFEYMKYYEDHYFDNFDYSDPQLLNTPIYDNKIKKYLELIERQNPVDSIIPIVDELLANSRNTPEMFRYMLISVHNHYAQSQMMCMDKVFVHIAKNYYIPEADWSDADYIQKLKNQVRRKQNIFCFDKAPELKMTKLPENKEAVKDLREKLKTTRQKGMQKKKAYDAKKKAGNSTAQDSMKLNNDFFYTFQEYEQNIEEYVSLQQVDANYTLLWFWEPSCSHCAKATPMLAEFHEKLKGNDFQVYAVFIQAFIIDWDKYTRHIDEWLEFVIKHNMTDIINTWDVHHESRFREFYDISGTPVAFLLDKDKKIIAKKMGIVQAEDILVERMLRDIREKYENEKEVLKQVDNFINDKFTLREIAALNYAVVRVFQRETGDKVKQIINKHEQQIKNRFDKKVKELCDIQDSKKRMDALEEYINDIYNIEDVKYIKDAAGKCLNDADKKKFDKVAENRIKYKLKE